ncbi:hypothetical protein D3C86_1876740 [compost metagenome]
MDKAGMIRQVAEARAKLDAIEAAIVTREEIEEEEPEERELSSELRDRIQALSLPQLEQLLAAFHETA